MSRTRSVPGAAAHAPTYSWTEFGMLTEVDSAVTTAPAARVGGLRRVAGITASLVGTQAFTSVLGLVFWTLAARRFSVADVGVAGAAVAMMMLLGSFGSLGLGTLLI